MCGSARTHEYKPNKGIDPTANATTATAYLGR